MKPSQDCFDLIKESEGLHRKRANGKIEAYLDPAKIPTIGYGSIFNIAENRAVKLGDIITVKEAEDWLAKEVENIASAVNSLCTVTLTQGMFDALVSFAFNVGPHDKGLKTSTLLKKLNGGDYEGAASEFDRWINGGGRVLPGLVTRRNNEEALFRRDGFPGTSSAVSNTVFADQNWESPELPLIIDRLLEEGNTGKDCYILNCALAELGYLEAGTQPGAYNSVTRDAVAWFQGDHKVQVTGKFGPTTKGVLTAVLTQARKRIDPKLNTFYCRLTRTGRTAYSSLEELLLEFISPQGNVAASLKVISGAPGRQNFRVPEDPLDKAGNLEPLPQGRYTIGDIMWAGARDDYSKDHAHETNGIGPVFVPIIKTFRDPKPRDAFGFHQDRNKSGFPGSAGCVCPLDGLNGLKELVRLLRLYDPRDLFVDWGIR
ncbi:glycoside hydrolase family protein [Nodosilinea sp. FACHB-131]|uniref:glycoside hydrolase family protein n=1 Tax=Cyanophyceae TaxID=3028117 RepID=UPI001683547E|nr:glycoside hydrolase family protein [Nodosilinea sp. FACHB-131]MBD1877255.1 glycoside hydrolase family protein [Nodosilinea sp. FACHB-131]